MSNKYDALPVGAHNGCSVGGREASYSGAKSGTTLDTLGQLDTFCSGDAEKVKKTGKPDNRLVKMAKAKYVTNALVYRLVDVPESPLHKAYWSTYHCASAMEQRGQSLKTKYCGHRWCLVCNRNRAAELMNGYVDEVNGFLDPHHLVLTKPTVDAHELGEDINQMQHTFKNIVKRLSKRGVSVKGLRKLECTYNPAEDRYHPHFHVIFETFAQANEFRYEWLKDYKDARFESQHLSRAGAGAMMELVKYFTKILPSSKASKSTGKVEIHPHALDTMFVAMRGKRTIQPFGGLKKKPTPKGKKEKADYNIKMREYGIWVWSKAAPDYEDFITGELLTGYKPDKVTRDFLKVIEGR